jgi:hypothetical protein
MNCETYSLHNKITFIANNEFFNFIMVKLNNYNDTYTYVPGNTLCYDHRVVLA